jgi:hypothetical protein
VTLSRTTVRQGQTVDGVLADSLAPGEVRRWTFTLDTLTNTEERSPLPPGSYDAAAGLDVVEKGVWYAPQLAFIIEG